jgi:SAM-dependent methyltransferase
MVADLNAVQLTQMIKGYWISQIVGTLARLEIADRLAHGPLDCDVLANAIGCEPQTTYRLLRASAHAGLVSALSDGRFALTPLGELLRSNVPGSMRNPAIALTAPGHWLPWGRLTEAVQSGERQVAAVLGCELFDYYAANPCEGGAFTGTMANHSASIADEVAGMLDTSEVRHVVDIGGAFGTILAALLEKNAALRGTILERADVVRRVQAAIAERGLSSRCQVIDGDFFKSVPEGDLYILKSIIHDWDDEGSIKILLNCVRALRPDGRVVLIDWVIPEGGQPGAAALSDLNMLVLLPGRERTASQFAELLRAAGLRLDRIAETASSMHVIEASRAASAMQCPAGRRMPAHSV